MKFMNANSKFGDHNEQVKLYVPDIGNLNIILGYPWLKESNPIIDWVAPSIIWTNTSVSATTDEEETSTEVDEERELLNHFVNEVEVVHINAKTSASQQLAWKSEEDKPRKSLFLKSIIISYISSIRKHRNIFHRLGLTITKLN